MLGGAQIIIEILTKTGTKTPSETIQKSTNLRDANRRNMSLKKARSNSTTWRTRSNKGQLAEVFALFIRQCHEYASVLNQLTVCGSSQILPYCLSVHVIAIYSTGMPVIILRAHTG